MFNISSTAMKILITGYSGFIGSYLLKRLNQTEHKLVMVDLTNGTDICDWQQVKQFEGIDIVIHLANLSFIPASYNEPKKFYETNYLSTLNMLELCRLQNAKMIYFSSYMYGHPQYQPIDENHPIQAYNPYSQTKVICESLCEGYNRDFKVPITIFRPFNIYGKGQNPDFLIPSIIQQARNGKIVIKDDRPKRDYIHVEDIVGAIGTAVESDSNATTMKKYLEPSLTIHDLAAKMKMPAHQLSKVINKEFRCNFFEFINKYRIEDFKQRAFSTDY